MKTESSIQITNSKSKISKHVFMALTGVVIAIICSLVLVQEINPSKSEATKSEVTESKDAFGFQVSTVLSLGSILK